jgi:hypothetical protein
LAKQPNFSARKKENISFLAKPYDLHLRVTMEKKKNSMG